MPDKFLDTIVDEPMNINDVMPLPNSSVALFISTTLLIALAITAAVFGV